MACAISYESCEFLLIALVNLIVYVLATARERALFLAILVSAMNSGAQAREARLSTMGKIFWEIYPCEKFWL